MNYQIEIQFTGTYQIDADTTVVNPMVIAANASDNFINTVSLSCFFQGSSYSYYRNIGSFEYTTTWGNLQVETYINQYMNNRKI